MQLQSGHPPWSIISGSAIQAVRFAVTSMTDSLVVDRSLFFRPRSNDCYRGQRSTGRFGQERLVVVSTARTFEGLLPSESCPMADTCYSARAVVGDPAETWPHWAGKRSSGIRVPAGASSTLNKSIASRLAVHTTAECSVIPTTSEKFSSMHSLPSLWESGVICCRVPQALHYATRNSRHRIQAKVPTIPPTVATADSIWGDHGRP